MRLCALLSFALAVALHAEDWPQFRGPTGLGYTAERDLPLTWNAKSGENIAWSTPLPKSDNPYSSPVVSGDRVFVTCVQNQPLTHRVLCFAKADGKQLWDATVEPGLIAFPVAYFHLYHGGGAAFDWGIFFCGLLVVAQFSYFGEYLPKIFPLHLRGTGGSFATNVGGRMIGTSAAFLTTNILAPKMSGLTTFDQVAFAAAIVGTGVFVIGFALTFLLPEPKPEGEG